MKQKFLILGVLLFISNYAMSQKIDDQEPLYARAGFKGGANYTNITGDTDGAEGRVRVHLGVVVEYPISRNFLLQAELLYTAQGYKIEVEGEEQKINLNYFTLPLLAKFHITNPLSIESGPQVGLLNGATNDAVENTDVFFDSFNSLEFSWAFGAGYKLKSGLFFQVRYNIGLTNINDTAVINIINNNAVAQLSIGYLFKTENNRRIIQEFTE
ncbi:porin family protein [Aquimarina sp. RZ0]|uniref:porin family protein n=1 Tax=Aquimarina sp. RZ0 TaxID=2607730 RepID=UPI0011F3E6A4|nr:porin family protein [Aquimarina sp. RZ0]KAA1246392.1 PorT family protein [Aquimarina sp. RZ0]